MQKKSNTSVLASYATLKSLSDEKKYKSPYQILREFIKYIITTGSLYTFSALEMKSHLADEFGFSIPEAVIKTSMKGFEGAILDNGIYNVSFDSLENRSQFDAKKEEADKNEIYIVQLLSDYIFSKDKNATIDKEELINNLTHFLTEDQSVYSNKYTDLISEFVLKNENNKEVQRKLDDIREGSILYIGLSHNINEIGSIKKPLTIYLGTEILFSLAGFNGQIYQQFADDFIEQVQLANTGKSKKIVLCYFSEIKQEVEEFFGTACDIVDGRRRRLLDKPAMQSITNGCSTAADVEVKKADFYHMLRFHYGIIEDPHDNYYDEVYFSTNLESFDYVDEEDKKNKKELAIKLISHINKLRNGNRYSNEIDAEHIIVTNTKAILMISKEQVDDIKAKEGLNNLCAFAVSLDRITSLLWYKLGNGFSKKTFPSSVSAILKARTVLSSSIAKNADRAFLHAKRQFEAGEITADQVAARIITLRNKPALPEDLQGDAIDEIMNFSPEYLSRYEEQVKKTQNLLEEKENIIESIKADSADKISKRDATIASQREIIKGKDDENNKLKSELEVYKSKKDADKKKKERYKNLVKFVLGILGKFILFALLAWACWYVETELKCSILSFIIAAADLVVLITSAHKIYKIDYKKYFPQEDNKK